MNEKVENLILEHLRAMRSDIVGIKADLSTLKAEMTAMRQQMAGVITLQDHDHSDIAGLKLRIDRIEKRLDIVE
ncbi:hypothetical protein E1180_11740 [Roseibium denhamense]|uniref:Uncharacterized protein n=1 Tax=Roseibium denhamense TaxID=76305 RepID=A0ABY1PEH0_9HYPH|nr:hypothetical protein [Roseibium denhamense]MTI06186.1 hypothetical protein [Roseibium denhamense]SMP32430.1 hypothetical protein SAMN06265374_3539 [Roseibium denhamense]